MQKLHGKRGEEASEEWKEGLCGWKATQLEKKTGHRPRRISWPKLGNTGLSPKNGGKLQKGFKQISKTRFAF